MVKIYSFKFFLLLATISLTSLGLKAQCNGGTISDAQGNLILNTCTQDGTPDVFEFITSNATGGSISYIVTDTNGIIVDISKTNAINFNNLNPGTCRVYAVAFDGDFIAVIGDNANTVAFSEGCYDLSDNFVEIIKSGGSAGVVTTTNAEDLIYTCPQGGNTDSVTFQTTNQTGQFISYIVTSLDSTILDVPPGNIVDFNNAANGTCLVWALSHPGNFMTNIGDNVGSISVSGGCASLSANFVTVIKDDADGGVISTTEGSNTVYTCTQDGVSDIVRFASTGQSNSNHAYLITTTSLEVLDIEFNSFRDFDPASADTCLVWGLSYTGNLTIQPGNDASNVAISDDCYDLSDNFITVIREFVDGGSISLEDGSQLIKVCVQDSLSDIVNFINPTASDSDLAYIITNEDLEIMDITSNSFYDFNTSQTGTCWVWTMAYTGNILAMVGDTLDNTILTDSCAAVSPNFVEVIKASGDDCTSSTSDFEASNNSIKIYPNPVSDIINIDLDVVLSSDATIEIYSILGEVLVRQKYEKTIAVNELHTGYYIISIIDKGRSFSQRFIKE